MSAIIFDNVKKTWHEIAKDGSGNTDFNFELEVYKKLLGIFHPGNYYYYVFNCTTTSVEFFSDGIKEVLGLTAEEEFTIEYLLSIIHPEDLSYFIDFEKQVTQFFNQIAVEKVLKYKVTYDYRVKHRDGRYIRLLQQVITIQSDEYGGVIRVLGIHTDISHLKKTNGSTLSFIGLEGEPSFNDFRVGLPSSRKTILTKQEMQILKLLVQGKTSKEIAALLFISRLTVDGHRKNMLRKANCKSTVELITKSLNENWLG